MTALAAASSICKQQTRPLVIEDAPNQQSRNCLDSNKNPVLLPEWVLNNNTDSPTDRRS
jgi:hypothetical protein